MDKKERIEKQIGTLKGIREMLDMNRTEFSRYMDIPLRTLRGMGSGKKADAGVRTQINCILR